MECEGDFTIVSQCNVCGGKIEFRYVDGRRVPIHLGGGCGGRLVERTTRNAMKAVPEPVICSMFTYSSFVVPNARCPVCGKHVFFYQSPHGGRVYFDEMMPPWPKHPCTDSSLKHTIRSLDEPLTVDSKVSNSRQDEGWKPFVCHCILTYINYVELRGKVGPERIPLTLFTDKIDTDFRHLPLLVRHIRKFPKQFQISTIYFREDLQKFVPAILIAFNEAGEYGKSKKAGANEPIRAVIPEVKGKPRSQQETAFALAWQKAQEKS